MANKKNKKKMNILSLIEDHHDLMRESIEVVKDEDEDDDEKINHLGQFISGLKMHSQAEEETLYSTLLDIKNVRSHFLEAQTEHALAEHLMTEIENLGFPDEWTDEIEAKGKVLVELVEHHMDEEEDQIFSDAEKYLSSSQFEDLGQEYLNKCEDILEDLERLDTIPGTVETLRSQISPH